MKKGSIYIAIVVLVFAILSGCSKGKRNDILGTWKQMSFVMEDSTSPKTLWTFNTDNTVVGEVYKNDVLIDAITAEYSVTYKKLQYRLDITREDRFEVNRVDYRGVYAINDLKRDKMTFVRIEGFNNRGEWSDGGDSYIQLEFVKY